MASNTRRQRHFIGIGVCGKYIVAIGIHVVAHGVRFGIVAEAGIDQPVQFQPGDGERPLAAVSDRIGRVHGATASHGHIAAY